MPALSPGPLPRASPAVVCGAGPELLLAAPAYPLELSEQALLVAISSPTSDELNAALLGERKLRLEWRLAVPARIQQALSRDMTLPLERRYRKAVARLEGNEIFNTSRAPDPLAEGPRFSQLPRPQSVVPGGFFADWNENETPSHEAFVAETAPQPAVQARRSSRPPEQGARTSVRRTTEGPYHLAPPAVPSRDLLPQRAVSSKPAGSSHVSEPSRRGPYSLAQARRDLASARTAEQVLRITFTYTIQFFDFLAAFTVREGAAHLKRTRGLPDSTPSAGPLVLSDCASLERAATECRHLIATVGEQPALRERLGLAADRRVAVLPIAVRQRTAILLVGGFDVGQPHSQHLKDASEGIPFVSHALERIILKRKSRPPS